MMPNYRHQCPEWDFLEIDADDPEFDCCTCEIDSDGRGPKFLTGEKVFVIPLKKEAVDQGRYVNAFFEQLAKDQQPLGDEFQKVLNDNLWDLYESGDDK